MIAPARLAAYEVLRAVGDGRSDLPHALARARGRLADERDRALAGEIAAGTLRWQAAFDHVIAAFARRPVHKLDPEVLDVVRLSMFQLLHLDRVPASAAVNDAVNLTRKAGKQSAAALVNAVLRRVSRERRTLPLPPRPPDADVDRDSALDYLSITLSHPRWLMSRWLDRYGFEAAERWAQFDNTPAALTLRANTLRITGEQLAAKLAAHGVETERGDFAADALIVRSGNPLLTPLASEGLFVVQDEASQLVAEYVNLRSPARVLDACAAPGGKTTAVAALMGDEGLVIACDVRAKRVDLLAQTVRVSGARSVRIVHADAARPLPVPAVFDGVLVDAPCSGLGTLRRDPDLRWRRSEAEFPAFATLQLAILEHTAAVVRPGGFLVYSTCSSEPEENEAVIDAFQATHDGWREPAAWSPKPPGVTKVLTPEGRLRTLPFRHGLEAFFAAMVVNTKDLR
jgi:16S rRNA (cytosine967-C5)-methyltransferase